MKTKYLVIAGGIVIVLFILYSLLHLFCCDINSISQDPKGFGQDPKELMARDLKRVSTAGYGITEPKEVEFKINSVLDKQEIIGSASLEPAEVGFRCEGSFCSTNFSQSEKGIQVKADSKANFVVCGADSNKQNPKYCIGLGGNAGDATHACLTLCNLN